MASPIAHSFAGFWTFLVFAKQLQIRLAAQWRQYLPQLGPWPKKFSSPLILLPGVRHTRTLGAIFSMDNAWLSIYELLTCGAITVIIFVLWKRKLKSQTLEKRKLKSRTSRPTSEGPA